MSKIEKGSKELPIQFSEQIRGDLIQRAVLAVQASKRQPYGTDPRAGFRAVTNLSRRRRDYKGSYGHGISRVPRKILSRNGTQMNWVGAWMPGSVKGRVAHPPKAEKIWLQKINEKENRKAIRAAIAATIVVPLIKMRGHFIPKDFPFILDNKIENLGKTKDVVKSLQRLGFKEELERASVRKIRSGKGKNRGRKYRKRIGPLFVVANNCQLMNSARNIPGVQVCLVQNLNAEILAPGTHPGRLTLWTEGAIDALAKQNLFTENYQGPKSIKEIKLEPKKVEAKKPAKVKVQKKASAKPNAEKKEVKKETKPKKA